MKIDNIDSITNKEKSPDKAERAASIEDIKKSQSKFFDYTNDLAATTATATSVVNCGSNDLLENVGYDTGTSKLKKLLLNSDPEVANLNEYNNNSNNVIKNEQENHNTSEVTNSSGKKIKQPKNALQPQPSSSSTATATSSSRNKQKLFLCTECNDYFLKLNLFNHMKSEHNKLTCLYCYGFFEKIEKLQQHLVRKHKVQNTTIYDEQSLKNCFNINGKIKEVSPDGFAASGNSSKVINAVCCKCASIFNMSENNFHTHTCGNNEKKSMALNSKQNNSLAVQQQQQQQNESNSIAKNQHLQINSVVSASATAKDDVYCEQAIQQWLQPASNNNISNNNSRTTFNGALSEISSQNNVPPPLSLPSPDTRIVTTAATLPSSSANTSSSSMSSHEQQKITNNNIENNNNNDNKLVVPKLTLKIPKAVFNHNQEQQEQSKQFDNIDSDEDSGDEEEDSENDEEEEEEEDSEDSDSDNNNDKSMNKDDSSSLSENDDKENEQQQQLEVKRPENMPSLKLRIKNLTSNPESVLENFSQLSQTEGNDVDLSECPMDIEQPQNKPEENEEEEEEEAEEVIKKIIIDCVEIVPANDDFRPHEINLDEALDNIHIRKFMKICLRTSFPFCLYCNHARKIVVNGKALAIHFITHHRFHAMVDSITAEEVHPEKIVEKFVKSVNELSDVHFNLDTYDDQDEEKREGHVTVSHDKLYECFQCRFQTSIHKELYLHNRKMHTKSPINCLMCKMVFYNYSELLCHICPGVANKQELSEYKFSCCLCNLSNIPSAFRLMVHIRRQHFACDVCLEKCCDQGKLSSHVWKHKLMHICYRCQVYYQNKADIVKHLFWKHGTEGIQCKKCLQKKWPHVYHFCIPPAVFSCTQCEMTFSRAMALNIHLRLHNEDGAKYFCTDLGCEKKFISKKLLVRHQERHQSELAALENGNQERSSEGTVIIPKEIPDDLCTRTMPVVFKRFTKKPPVRKIEEETKIEEKVEEVKKEEKKTLPDLPETNLNLSESSDNDSLSDDDESKKKTRSSPKTAPISPGIPLPFGTFSNQSETIKPETTKNPQQTLKKGSSLTDSEDDDENGNDNSEQKPNEPMKNILENLKTFQESQNPSSAPEEAAATEIQAAKKEEDIDVPDKLPEKAITHVCQSDHDYANLWKPLPGTTSDDLEDMIKSQTIDKDKNKKKEKSEAKSAQKNSKKKPKNDDFSSSDSSSGSSSDSSSGSSSGSSSSGSSSSTSDSSSSEASTLTTSKPRTKKFTKKRSKKDKKAEQEPEESETQRDPDDIIYESDLLTDETDTDEEFYDKHPIKDSNAQQQGLIDGTVNDIIVPNSRPTTPSLPPEEKIIVEKRMKIKKRKREHKKSFSSPIKRFKEIAPPIQTSTPVPRIELHQANQIRQLLQCTQQQPVLPILKEQPQPQYDPYINVSRVTSAASSRMNSDTEAAIKRSQRKRIPNKFYGYTSDDESMAAHAALNDPFKPIPPPNLTWRKEDLPSRCKSPTAPSPSLLQKVAPFKLNLAESPQVFNNQEMFNSINPVSEVNHTIVESGNNSPTTDDEQLFISESRNRKRKLPPSQSMYAFHTLETPPTVSQPPIPRLKLTIGSNNKIRRRNINPLKPPPARKRKIANKSMNDAVGGKKKKPTFNDLQLSARILKSPPPVTFAALESEPMTVKKAQENLEKQQKLEEAIQNTQMYFQRYNHTQVGGSGETSQETGDVVDCYCYCRRAYDEQQGMIGCDGPACQIEWFHFECVGILVPPRGSWYCPQCQQEQQVA